MNKEEKLLFLKRKQAIYAFMCSPEYKPMKHKQLAAVLMVKKTDKKVFGRIMESLIADKVIMIDGHGNYIRAEFSEVTGEFAGYGGGEYGFVRTAFSEEDIYIPRGKVNGAIHGDTVRVKLNFRPGRRTEGVIIDIIKRKYEIASGIYEEAEGLKLVKPDAYRIGEYVKVDNVPEDVFVGDRVVVRIHKFRRDNMGFLEGSILKSYGRAGNPYDDLSAVVKTYCVEDEFDERTLAEASLLPCSVSEDEIQDREDFRGEITYTIDGVDTKDFDDAVTISFDGVNYQLGVHIADVSHYVKPNTALDHTALNRTESIYMPDRVIPMLPFELSNGICSLQSGVDRLTLSCIMTINPKGEIIDHRICRSVIRVDERMNYDDVSAIIEGKSDELREKYAPHVDTFMLMKELSDILYERRKKAGQLNMSASDVEVKLDDNQKPLAIEVRTHGVAGDIIEQFMIAANATVAEHFYWLEAPFLYRVHENPDANFIEELEMFLEVMGTPLGKKGKEVTHQDFQRLFERLEGNPKGDIIRKACIRSMKKAKYSPKCMEHFGLALPYYTHFTSPIRRYCDLQIHRIIKLYLKGKMKERNVEYYKERLENVALKINITDKSAVEVMRESVKYEMAYYMEDHIGEEYDAVITSFVGPGIYVLINNAIDVMIPENGKHRLKIDNNGYTATHTWFDKRICVGDKVRVKITNADRMRRIIDAEFVRCDDVKG